MKRVLFILTCAVMLCNVAAQDLVYLEHCETLSFDQNRLPDAQLLKGNVRFRHEEALMYCDSAYFYEKTNSLDAFGHVRFVQGDTLEGVGEWLHYDGNTKRARLKHNVVLTHVTTILNTDSLDYDRSRNLAYYFTGGTIRDGDNLLSSVWGSYNVSNKTAEFKNTVHLENTQATLDADSLVYSTGQHLAKLVRPTVIVYKDETTVLSCDGWYNTSNDQSMLLSRSRIIHQDGKQLTGDTIFYDRRSGQGNVFGHMEMTDTVQKVTLYGNYGIMHEVQKKGFATDSAYFEDWSQPNHSYIHADTIFTEEVPYQLTLLPDSVHEDTIYLDSVYRQARAFYHVRGYNRDYQFVCDSLLYNGRDSIITMFTEPVCWSDDNQISADTIFIVLKDSTVDYIHGVGAALGIKQEGAEEFDQLSGKDMKAYIRNGELKEIQVSGNAETVFYPRNEDSTYVGVNKSQSSYVNMFLENNKLHHVLFTTATSGTLYPLSQITPEETRLIGFFWADQERPVSRESIFIHPERTPRPKQKAMSATEDEEEEETPIKKKTNRRNRKEK